MPIISKQRSHTLNKIVKKKKPKNTSFRMKTFKKDLQKFCQHSGKMYNINLKMQEIYTK